MEINNPLKECSSPRIYKDHTARIWEPNDQTIYTADEYGILTTNKHGYEGYQLPLRQNYAFTGETLKYFIIVEDENGKDDIDRINLLVNGAPQGNCAEVPDFAITDSFISDDGKTIDRYSYNPDTMKSYVCTFIVQSNWIFEADIRILAWDGKIGFCPESEPIVTSQSDYIVFNPTLSIEASGPIEFGSVEAGSTALSNTIYISNYASILSDRQSEVIIDVPVGVLMDMYIASADYFTDPQNPKAICGDGNGIKYDQISYYATKGTLNSGKNNNKYPGLGENSDAECIAANDEFTRLPSHSGEIKDMCRIINWNKEASLLNGGADMSLTFQIDVPENCQGNFIDGKIHFIGRVV